MPLHLLSKKSWNVYSPANRARVARDEALAAAANRDDERERKDLESGQRIGLLQQRADGQDAPPPLSQQDKLVLEATKDLSNARRDTRKRKRLPGEDDTERDIREAKERGGRRGSGDDAVGIVKLRATEGKGVNAPIADRRGNINLFPNSELDMTKQTRRSEVEAEHAKRKEAEENQGMHLTDAFGRKDAKGAWYLDRDGSVKDAVGKDVWGNADPRKVERQAKRTAQADPLAFMRQAQSQLKEARRERDERDGFRRHQSRDPGDDDRHSKRKHHGARRDHDRNHHERGARRRKYSRSRSPERRLSRHYSG